MLYDIFLKLEKVNKIYKCALPYRDWVLVANWELKVMCYFKGYKLRDEYGIWATLLSQRLLYPSPFHTFRNDVSLTKLITFAFAISFVTGILSTRDNSCLFIQGFLGKDFLFLFLRLLIFNPKHLSWYLNYCIFQEQTTLRVRSVLTLRVCFRWTVSFRLVC